MMKDNYMLPVVVAAAAVLVFVLIRAKRQEKQYDERQLLARNAAFKTAFLLLSAYCFVCSFLGLLDIRWLPLEIQMVLGVVLSLTVFACICIIKDAYFDFQGKNRVRMICVLYSVAAVNFISVIIAFANGMPLVQDGRPTDAVSNLFVPVCFLVVGTVTLIKHCSEKNSEVA